MVALSAGFLWWLFKTCEQPFYVFQREISYLTDKPTDVFLDICILSLVITHTRLTALFPGLPGWSGTRKVKPIWILLKQEAVSLITCDK